MDAELCVEGLNRVDQLYVAIGLYIYGCKPLINSCNAVFRVEDNAYIIDHRGVEYRVCTAKHRDCTVSLNNRRGDAYLHLLLENGDVKEGYATDVEVDPRIFTGLLACLLENGHGLRESFNRAFNILGIGGGNPFKYFRVIVSEHNCFNRLLDAVDRLYSNRGLLDKILVGEVLLGCRCLGEYVYLSRITGSPRYPVLGFIEKLSVRVYDEYGVFDEGSSFICMGKGSLERDRVLEYGYRVVDFKNYACIVGNDLVRLVVLLEKIYS